VIKCPFFVINLNFNSYRRSW